MIGRGNTDIPPSLTFERRVSFGEVIVSVLSAALGKAAVSGGAREALAGLREQIARRGAEFGDLAGLMGAERELDEALSVLSGDGDTLPAFLWAKLKGVISQRPSSFEDEGARHFVADDRVIALVKSGARRIFENLDIDEERAEARTIYVELSGEEAGYGERLLDEAVNFCVLTLLARLTPGDRLIIEKQAEYHAEVIEKVDGLSAQLADLKDGNTLREPPAVDSVVLDRAVEAEVRKLRRQRFIHDKALAPRAEGLGARLEEGLQLASSSAKALACREIAVVLSRADRPDDAEAWIAKAVALGASDVDPERARVASNRDNPDEAMRLLRDRNDPVSRSLLIDAIQRRDGEGVALRHFEEHYSGTDLTGHALQSMGVRLHNAGRAEDAERLLEAATNEQIDENPVLLFVRARMAIAGAFPSDVAERFFRNGGMIPRPDDLRDDPEGKARLERALVDLRRLQGQLPELDADELAALVDLNIVFLELNSGDEAQRAATQEALIERLANPSEAMALVPLAAMYDLKVDWASLRAQLDQAERLGGWDDVQLRAAFALVMEEKNPSEIADFAQKHRAGLEPFLSHGSVVALEIEARAKMGQIDEARALLEQERGELGEDFYSFLVTTISEEEGADSVSMRIAQFDRTDSTHDLQILTETLGRNRDERTGEYLVLLWERRHQLEDARRACDALHMAGKEQELEDFLERLGDRAREDHHLRTHLAWARQRQGRLNDAATELKALKDDGVDDANTRQLTVMLALESGRWSDLELFTQAELSARESRTGAELLTAARIATVIGSPSAMALARAAVLRSPEDPLVNVGAYQIAIGRGEERTVEVNEWLRTAIEGSNEDGPLHKGEFEDAVAMIKESKEHHDRLSDLVMTSEIPLFLAMRPLNATLSELILNRMRDNAEEGDSRKRLVLPLFSGNRERAGSADLRSIAFDPLSLLVFDYLGLLDRVLGAFDDVVLPAGTLHSLFEEMGRSGPVQPTRIEQARDLKERISAAVLKIDALPPADQELAKTVGEEFARLHAAAEARDGYVIDTAPLHKPHQIRETVDHKPFSQRLLSPAGLIASLLENGTLSDSRAQFALEAVAGAGGAWEGEPMPDSGRPMFLSMIAAHYLLDAGLLPELARYAGELVVLPEVAEMADREIAAGEAAGNVRRGIERIRLSLADALAAGRARVGPSRQRRGDTDDLSKSVRGDMGPVVSVMLDSGGIEALVCDDRGMNKYGHFTDQDGRSVPILTSVDVLRILHSRNALTDSEVSAARERLRMGGAGLVPIDPEEVAQVTIASNWAFGPNAELRAIRDSVHLPLARKVVQLPKERLWFKMAALTIAFAIRKAWQEIEDITHAERAATYLFEMIPDAEYWSSGDESADRALWVQDVSRHALWAMASVFDLPAERAERYRLWFDTLVGPIAERRDPGAMEAVARTLFSFLAAPIMEGESSDGD